jgi:hypothetical protein
LVLNDVGPAIAWGSVQRMQIYVGQYGQYRDLDEAAAALRALSPGFGLVRDQFLEDLAQFSGAKFVTSQLGRKIENATFAALGIVERAVVAKDKVLSRGKIAH